VVLVTGAGFSRSCKNATGSTLPIGNELAGALYQYLYDEPYDGTSSLKTLYSAATRHKKGMSGLREFLRLHLHATEIPDWYKLLPFWFWRRIYTFNADDVLEQSYSGKRLQTIVAPDSYEERDQFLHIQQYIKLHGSISSDKDLTFGPKEYGTRAAARTDVWYLHFVEDYSTFSTIFVGTTLDEPIFQQYVEARGAQQLNGDKVRRPKCFLVSEHISRPAEDSLQVYNIFPIRANAEDFFRWLHSQQEPMPREGVLRLINSGAEPALRAAEANLPSEFVAAAEHFFTVFRAPTRSTTPHPSVLFLMGAPPSWDDIASDLDAPREFNDTLHEILVNAFRKGVPEVIQVGSPAGGGKSTALRRAALTLVDEGYSVYFSDASAHPDPSKLASYISTLEGRCFLFFDNAGPDILQIADLWKLLKSARNKPVLVVASRSNDLAYYGAEFMRGGAAVTDFQLGDLTDKDCVALVKVLDTFNILGALKDKSDEERLQVFREKARKQILVAMKEATSGRGFDEILRDEYNTLVTADAKLLYLISSVASDDGYGLSVQAMIGAMDMPPNETLHLVETNLKGILVRQSEKDSYCIRHPSIAHFIMTSAPRSNLGEAFGALLISLATIMPSGREKRKTREFRLYRRIISHTVIQSLFPDRTMARLIYEQAKDYYRDDGHYWLQYASYEIEGGGDIALAENYLHQAEAILGSTRQVETAMAHLLFRKAALAQNAAEAGGYKDEALKILRSHMADRSSVSMHALHIFGDQMANYIERWVPVTQRSAMFGATLKELRSAIPEQLRGHRLLEATARSLQKAQLETVVRPR
jgi:hypothetical protein